MANLKYIDQGMKIGNQIKEESLACSQQEIKIPLVTELWASRQTCNKIRVKSIAERSGLPLVWVDNLASYA